MSVHVVFTCNGCGASAKSRFLEQKFISITGKSHGIGSYHHEKVLDVVPEGWVAWDMIGSSYCPKCAAEIWPEQVEVQKAVSP